MSIYQPKTMRKSPRNRAENEAMSSVEYSGGCVWPECNTSKWSELRLHVCQYHAARVYTTVSAVIPTPALAPTRAKAGRSTGRVYFARVGEYVKIGFSANVEQRMVAIKGEHLASFKGTLKDEKATHVEFAEYHVGSEFFRPGPRLVERIQELARAAA